MVSPDLLNKVQPTEPKEWLIRDVQDGYERTTQHMQITKFTMSGLREGISNKWVLNKELFTSICAVLSDVWQREPALFLVVVLSSCADAAYVAMQTYFEAQMVMITQAYIEHGSLQTRSALMFLLFWCVGALVKKALYARFVPYFGRFQLLYNMSIQQSILSASVDMDLETREKQSTRDHLEAAQKLVIQDSSLYAMPLLPETLVRLMASCFSLPLRLLAILAVVPRSSLPLIVSLGACWIFEDPLLEALSGTDWSLSSTTVSVSNAALLRMKRLFQLSTDNALAKDTALLGISAWISEEYSRSKASLSPGTAPTRQRLDTVLVENQRNARKVIRPCIELAVVIVAQSYNYLALNAGIYAVVKNTSHRFAAELRSIKFIQQDLARQMHQFASLQDYIKLGRECSAQEAQAQSMPSSINDAPGLAIELRDVCFCYPNQEDEKKQVLKNLSAKIPAGALVAVVGYNGAGKSSLISILGRAYDVQSGQVLINGQDVRNLKRRELASVVSILPQNGTLFDLSLKENIAFQDCDNENVCRRAAQASGARGFIEKLDQQYDSSPASAIEKKSCHTRPSGIRKPCATDQIRIVDENGRCLTSNDRTLVPEDLDMSKEANQKALSKLLSHEVKAGAKFSGGELQKIVLSRPFAKSDTRLVVFDEPASNLDPESEHQLFKEIYALKGQKTVIYISHRWKGITDRADLVLFMEEGSIKEEGTHQSLMAQDGTYARLWRLQTEGGGLARAEEVAEAKPKDSTASKGTGMSTRVA